MVDVVSHVPVDLAVDQTYTDMIGRVVEATPALVNLTVLPHWSYEWLEPPKGFVATFDADAPFQPDVFRCNMFQSTTVTVVSDDARTRPNINRSAILAATPRVSTRPARFPSDENGDSMSVASGTTATRVDMDWTPSLGSRGSYIGIYDTTFDCDQANRGARVIVCKAGIDEKTYEEMEAFFDEQPNDATFRSVFSDRRIEKFKALLRYNRQRLVYNFAAALGVSTRARKMDGGTNLAISNFETLTNTVVVGERTVKFYSDCARTSNVRCGLVVDRTHMQGPLVFMRAYRASPGPWSNASDDSFPTRVARLDGRSCDKESYTEEALRRVIVCEDGRNLSDELGYFCQRTPKWLEAEKLLGYDFNNVGECIPVCVRT